MSEILTYGRLGRALTALAFTKKVTPEFTVFHNAEHDALIVLPNTKPEEAVRPAHRIAVRKTVIGRGVAGPAALQKALRQACASPASFPISVIVAGAATRPRGSQERVGNAARTAAAKAALRAQRASGKSTSLK